MNRITAVIFALIVLLGEACKAQSQPRQMLLALSKADHTLAIVDPAT